MNHINQSINRANEDKANNEVNKWNELKLQVGIDKWQTLLTDLIILGRVF